MQIEWLESVTSELANVDSAMVDTPAEARLRWIATLENGWQNGEGTGFAPRTIIATSSILRRLRSEEAEEIQVAPDLDGSIAISFFANQNFCQVLVKPSRECDVLIEKNNSEILDRTFSTCNEAMDEMSCVLFEKSKYGTMQDVENSPILHSNPTHWTNLSPLYLANA